MDPSDPSSSSSASFDSAYALNKNDAWHVITAYFAEKGLVRQQLDSFDQFIENTMQEVVEESLPIDIYPDSGYNEEAKERERHRFKFGQVYLSAPQMVESDGKIDTMLPNTARTRNLTYCAPLFVEVTLTHEMVGEDGAVLRVMKSRSERVFLGRIPIMLHSSFCVLKDKSERQLADMKECVYDQGGYFVINGSEKVLIAQERMASNHVYIFSGQKKGSYQAEIRSMAESSSRVNSVMYVKLVTAKSGSSNTHAHAPRLCSPSGRATHVSPLCLCARKGTQPTHTHTHTHPHTPVLGLFASPQMRPPPTPSQRARAGGGKRPRGDIRAYFQPPPAQRRRLASPPPGGGPGGPPAPPPPPPSAAAPPAPLPPAAYGGGFAYGTRLLLYIGGTVLVENLVAGTLLMGPESRPRVVSAGSVVHGTATNMFTLQPGPKSGAEPFTVCGDRPIALVNSTQSALTHNDHRPNRPWSVSHWEITQTMRLLTNSFADEDEAYESLEPEHHGLDYWSGAWDPLFWNVSLDQYYGANTDKCARNHTILTTSPAVIFCHPGRMSLHDHLTAILTPLGGPPLHPT